MPKSKPSTIKLQVFKGREAKLNKAIFTILAHKGPQTIYDVHKQVRTTRGFKHTKYASVNKRVRALEESGYINRIGAKKTIAGFEASIYELYTKAYLATLLDSTDLECMLTRMNENTASAILATLMYEREPI